jgi:archaemetzincin
MKRRRIASDVNTTIFAHKKFVVSNSYNSKTTPTRDTVQHIIKNNGGTVQKDITKNTDYFVQSFLIDDDDRLEIAKVNNVLVIGPDFLDYCIKQGNIADHVNYALNSDTNDNVDLTPLLQKFPSIEEYTREAEEQPQTYYDFLNMERYSPDDDRRTIYVLPLLCNTKRDSTVPCSFIETYFGLKVTILPTIKLQKTIQVGDYLYTIDTKKSKYNVMQLLDVLEENLPSDGFCIMSITDADIYEPGNNGIIMGRATGDRVCVVSMFHFLKQDKWLIPFLKTMTHELLHVFGIDHCAYFSCVMNACVSDGSDNEPVFMCPIDLAKLRKSIGFDAKERYQKLLAFFTENEMEEEIKFLSKIKFT